MTITMSGCYTRVVDCSIRDTLPVYKSSLKDLPLIKQSPSIENLCNL